MIEWISIKDKLPGDGQKVIFCIKGDDESSSGDYDAGRGKFYELCFDESLGWPVKDISHWMPLPEPPKLT